jgi:solute carrier family 25 protein 39/40
MYGRQKDCEDCGRVPGLHCKGSLYALRFTADAVYRAIGVPSATAYMLTYDYLQHEMIPHLLGASTWTPLFAGMVARASVTSVVSPLELIRTNLQSTPISPDQPNTLTSVLSSLRQLIRTNGVQHLWRGLGATLWRDVPFSGLYWASYETGKQILRTKGHDGAPAAFASGAMSGILAAIVTSPFDVLKTRRQAMVMSGSTSRTAGSLSLVKEIIQTEGASTLFTGLGPRMVKIAPACGIMIACYEVRGDIHANDQN